MATPALTAKVTAALAALLCANAARGGQAPPVPTPRPAAPAIRIELRPDAEVRGPRVTLGDVAVITTRDLLVLEQLMALPLGLAPRAGGSARLARPTLERWVRVRGGVDPREIAWRGAEATTVRAAVQALSGEDVARTAGEALRAAVSARRRVEIEAWRKPPDTTVPAGRIDLRTRPITAAALLATRPTVWVDVSVDGRLVRTVPVAFEVRERAEAWVATEKLPAGSPVDRSKLELRQVEARGVELLPVDDAALAMRLRRAVPAGGALARADVEPAPLVRRGAWATLETRNGPMRLQARVEVLEDGASGDTVRVRVPRSSGAVLARVTGHDRVEVQP